MPPLRLYHFFQVLCYFFWMLDIFLECHDIIHAPLWRYCTNRAFSPYQTTFFIIKRYFPVCHMDPHQRNVTRRHGL